MSNSVEKFADVINSTMEKNIPGLETSVCAWPTVLSLLFITQNDPEIDINLIEYRNSGDIDEGDKSRVVGYNAISFTKPSGSSLNKSKENNDMTMDKNFVLTDNEKKILLGIARNTLEQYIRLRQTSEINTSGFTPNLV